MSNEEKFRTRIWNELPEPDNPFAAKRCYCHGYDVYGDLLGKISWIEYLFLLFIGERPNTSQLRTLDALAVSLANPGIRDYSVQAAMNCGVGGSTNAACLIAALAVGAGQLGGAHEIYRTMEYWHHCGLSLDAWKAMLESPSREGSDIWLPMEHSPGFDPHGASCATPVKQLLEYLSKQESNIHLAWLHKERRHLEKIANLPLALSGVAAASLVDLGFSPQQGEMLYLLLRLPGAAAHAIEQQTFGWRNFPFYGNAIEFCHGGTTDSDDNVNDF